MHRSMCVRQTNMFRLMFIMFADVEKAVAAGVALRTWPKLSIGASRSYPNRANRASRSCCSCLPNIRQVSAADDDAVVTGRRRLWRLTRTDVPLRRSKRERLLRNASARTHQRRL